MAGAAEFVVKLTDRVSGPAKSAASSVEKLSGRMRDARGRFVKAGGAMGGAMEAAGEAGSRGMFQTFLRSQLAASAIMGVAGAALDAARALAGLAAAGVKKLAQSVEFAENIRFALTRFLGSAGAADKALSRILKTANQLGVSFQDAASEFRAFVSAGFSEEDALGLVKFKADILAIGDGTDATAERVTEAFKQVEKAMAAGRIEADGFYSILGNLPVTKMQVLEKYAKLTGEDLAKVSKMDITKLKVPELIKALQEATLEATKFGKLGEAAIKKQLSTMSGMWKFIKNNLTNAFDAIALKVAPRLAKSLLPIMQKLADFLGSDEFANFASNVAENLANAIAKAADAIERFVKAAQEADVSEKLQAFVATADSAASAITRLLVALHIIPGSAEGAGSGLGRLISVLNAIAAAVGFVVDVVAVSFEILNTFWTKLFEAIWSGLTSVWDAITGAGSAALSAALSLGSGIIDGIVQGISGAASSVISALTGVVGDAITQAKAMLGISSPSKVFAAVGANTAAGMAKGLEDGTPMVQAAMSGMVAPNITSGGTTVNHISTAATVTIPAAADPQATAEAVRQMVVSQLGDTLEQLTIQVGAA